MPLITYNTTNRRYTILTQILVVNIHNIFTSENTLIEEASHN